MHFCTAHISIGGDPRNIMYRDQFSPVSWPEVEVLREIHGHDAVSEIIPFTVVNQTARDERQRLASKYGDEVLATRWGGKNPPTELDAPGVRIKPEIIWQNPLSGQTEKTTTTGSEPYTIPPETRPVAEIVGNYAVRDDAVKTEARGTGNEMYSDDDYPEVIPIVEEDPTAPKLPSKTKK